jgi:hypothetical protein
MLLTERAGVRGDNQNNNFPDQFAAQVITTAQDRVVVRVKRLDGNGGWGQNLRLDLFVVDRVVNPWESLETS